MHRDMRFILKKILLLSGGFFLSSVLLFSEDYLYYGFDSHYTIVERQDVRQRQDGKYKGFVFREMRGILEAVHQGKKESEYEGSFYIYRKMTRNGLHVAKAVDTAIPASFAIDNAGRLKTSREAIVPPIQNFPALPSEALNPGDTWRDYGLRVVDPTGDCPTRVKILSEYVYQGLETVQGISRYKIRAQYALRYRKGEDPFGDPNLMEIHGKHLVDIYFSEDGSIFMRDTLEDRYTYDGGHTIEESGIILTWFDDISGMDRGEVKKNIAKIAEDDTYKDITIKERPEGIVLEIQNINFYPDEDKILPGQESKIRTIANILKEAGGHTFLVTGHTADVGTAESQQLLSEQRAKVIVQLLTNMGIPADKLIYMGKGGTEPIAPNDNEENMAKNRRVEITILEGTR